MAFVRKFMMLPEIYRYAAEYGVEKENTVFVYGPKEFWLTYRVGTEPVGLINMHIETGSMCQFHPYILREFKGYYDAMVRAFFDWFMEKMPLEAVKLNAIIPTIFKGALKAAERAKMKTEGLDRMSYRTADGVCDRVQVGITREEMRNG